MSNSRLNYSKLNCVVCNKTLEGGNMIGWFHNNNNGVLDLYSVVSGMNNPLRLKKATLYCNACSTKLDRVMWDNFKVTLADWSLNRLESEDIHQQIADSDLDKDIKDDLLTIYNHIR